VDCGKLKTAQKVGLDKAWGKIKVFICRRTLPSTMQASAGLRSFHSLRFPQKGVSPSFAKTTDGHGRISVLSPRY